jgi:hypothetical protein
MSSIVVRLKTIKAHPALANTALGKKLSGRTTALLNLSPAQLLIYAT